MGSRSHGGYHGAKALLLMSVYKKGKEKSQITQKQSLGGAEKKNQIFILSADLTYILEYQEENREITNLSKLSMINLLCLTDCSLFQKFQGKISFACHSRCLLGVVEKDFERGEIVRASK